VSRSLARPEFRNGKSSKNGSAKPAVGTSGLIDAQADAKSPAWPAPYPPAVPVAAFRPRPCWYAWGKQAADVALAVMLLVLTAPLLLLAAVLVKATSRGPVLYSQVRLGLYGRPFTLYKVRTMAHQCESLTGIRWSKPGDPRVSPVGRFLRRAHLDELPQLWNVIRGEMSLVGPRPERPEFVPQLEQVIPRYRDRLLIRPGLTGLAQVQLPADTDLASVAVKLAYDLYYVRHVNGGLDMRLLMATALKIVGIPFGGLRLTLCLPPREMIVDTYWASLPARPKGKRPLVKI
jgi:lipopolysaccharide/colanic/teichoic acid biosynthesis glycosyltransferase